MKKTNNTTSVMGIEIARFTHSDLYNFTVKTLTGTEKVRVAKCPSEFIQRAIKNSGFRNILNDFELCIADGVGVLWAAKYLSLPGKGRLKPFLRIITTGARIIFDPSYIKDPLPERLSGVDAFLTMIKAANDSDESVFLFGGHEEVLSRTASYLKNKFPDLRVVGLQSGYGFKTENVITKINKARPSLLIVALGSPKQEQWIYDNLDKLEVKMAVGEGGTFDFIAGRSKRAPMLIRRIGLEWLWRIFFSPNRTSSEKNRLTRIWNAVPIFITQVYKWKVKNG